MTKKNILLAAIALLSVCALYAFAYPEVVRENVLTILFPDGERPLAAGSGSRQLQSAAPTTAQSLLPLPLPTATATATAPSFAVATAGKTATAFRHHCPLRLHYCAQQSHFEVCFYGAVAGTSASWEKQTVHPALNTESAHRFERFEINRVFLPAVHSIRAEAAHIIVRRTKIVKIQASSITKRG